MLKNTINIIFGSVALATAFSVLLHDTQLDRAVSVAIALPIATLGYAASDATLKATDGHIHVERVSLARISGLRTALPCLNPRENTFHAKKQQGVAFLGPDSAETLWPSV